MQDHEVVRHLKEFKGRFRELDLGIVRGWGRLSQLEDSQDLDGIEEMEQNRRKAEVFRDSVSAAKEMLIFVDEIGSKWAVEEREEFRTTLANLVDTYSGEVYKETGWLEFDGVYRAGAAAFALSFCFGLV